MLVFISIVLVLIIFSILVMGHETGHFLMAKFFGLDVQEFGFGFPPKIFSKKINGTNYSLNAIPLGGYVTIKDLDDEERAVKIKKWKRAAVFLGGVIVNLLIGWLAFSLVSQMNNPKGVMVVEVLPQGAAYDAHILKGDLVYGFKTAKDLSQYIAQSGGNPIKLNVLHQDGKEETITVTPRLTNGRVIAGVELIGPWNPWKSFAMGLNKEWEVIKAIYSALYGMAVHRNLSNVSGPVGVFVAVKDFGTKGSVYFFYLLGLISVNLAVFNVLPLPLLDGGHLLFLFIEAVIRKPLNAKARTVVTYGSGALLLALMVFATIKDVMRLL